MFLFDRPILRLMLYPTGLSAMLCRAVEFASIDGNRQGLLVRERPNTLNRTRLYLPVGYGGHGLSCRDDTVEPMNLQNLHQRIGGRGLHHEMGEPPFHRTREYKRHCLLLTA